MPIGRMWASLDGPEADADGAKVFWCAASGSTLSGRRGAQGEFGRLLTGWLGWLTTRSPLTDVLS